MTPSVNEVVSDANTILNTLCERALGKGAWKEEVMGSGLAPERADATIERVLNKKEEFKLGDPVGVVRMSTTAIKEAVQLTAERSAAALQLLKDTGRVVQGGQGRGKCFVVLSNEGLVPEALPPEVANNLVADIELTALELVDQLRVRLIQDEDENTTQVDEAEMQRVQAEHDKVKQWAETLLAENSTLTRQLDEARVKVGSQEEIIQKLERQLAEKTVSTWQ